MADGKVVIVAGFQGQSAKALELTETTTLGRGGSDTTAVALAAALRADRCQIYTDVKGIYTADPRLVPDARQLPVIGYEEMLELAHQGAQVMQVRAVELGWVNDVVIEVLSSFEDAPGTLIKEDPLVEQRNKVRGIAQDRNVAKVTLVEVPDRPGVAHAVFAPLADGGISVDMIVQNVGHGGTTDMSFTVPRVELAKAKRVLEPLVRDLGFREMTTDASIAKVSIVGAGLHNAPGYAARMFGTLSDAGVNIEMISTSEVRITCTIAEHDLEAAVRALHAAFELATAGPGRRTGRRTARGGREPVTAFLARQERFERIGSTNDAVRAWLDAGTPEVCLAVADEQTAGRGRAGRTWTAPPGAALLLSRRLPAGLAGARPRLAPRRRGEPGDGRRGRGRRRPPRPRRPPEVAERPRDRGGRARSASGTGLRRRRRSASWAASWARPTASGRTTRGSWSGSASTPAGRAPTSRPRSRRR